MVRSVLEKNKIADLAETQSRLRRFVELLIQWNRSVSNLISKNDEERVVEAHLLPSIEAAGWLKSHNLGSWCDLGSGGGFPALPLAICGVGVSWDLVESRRTKTLFLRRAVGELGLGHVRVFAARIEDLLADLVPGGAESEDAEASWGEGDGGEPGLALSPPYDGFTSRATLSLPPTLAYAAPIVREGGHAFLWKGSRLAAEAGESEAWKVDWEPGESKPLSIEHSVVANFIRSKE